MKTWRFVTILLSAIALSAALAHLMELPGKMTYDGPLYAKLHRTLYPTFGRTAGWAEGIGLILVAGLAWRVRRREGAFALTAAAAACQLGAMAVFLAFVLPANRTMAGWSLDAVPPGWEGWRNQWEYGHAARAVLLLVGFAALVLSVVRETPAEVVASPTPRPAAAPGPAAVLDTPRSGTHAVVVTAEAPGEGLRVVFVPEPRKALPGPPGVEGRGHASGPPPVNWKRS